MLTGEKRRLSCALMGAGGREKQEAGPLGVQRPVLLAWETSDSLVVPKVPARG